MNSFDTRLAERLHVMVDGETGSAPPVGSVLIRGRAAGRRRTALRVAGASLAVLVAGGVVATVAHPGTPRPPGTAAQAPRLTLAAAVSASENISYRIRMSVAVKSVPGSAVDVSTGAFDPATATGYLHTPAEDGPGFGEQRLVGGVRFLGDAGADRKISWRRVPGRYTSLDFTGNSAGGLSASADPAALLETLRNANAVITSSGPDAYHFTFAVATKDLLPSSLYDRFAGDVTVGADHRIAAVTYERKLQWHRSPPRPDGRGDGPPVDFIVTMAFSDYGVPVKITAPSPAK